MTPVNRQRKGIPIGGQFAATAHGEPAVSLLPTRPIEPLAPTTQPTQSNGHLDARWDEGLAELAAWVKAHGAIPRRRSSDPDELRSANWLNVQRTHRRKNTLAPERVARLGAISGALEVTARANRIMLPGSEKTSRTVSEQIADVADFYAEHQRLPHRQSGPAVQSLEHSLYLSLDRARGKAREGTLPPDVLAALSALPGGVLDGWNGPRMTLDEVRAFAFDHGNLPTSTTDVRLYSALRRALTGKGSSDADISADLRAQAEALVAEFPHDPAKHTEQTAAAFPRTQEERVLVARVEEIEDHIREHGFRPATGQAGGFGNYKPALDRRIGMPSTPEEFRDRMRAILAAPTPSQTGIRRARQPGGLGAESSTVIDAVRAYALQFGHLPKQSDDGDLYDRLRRAVTGKASRNLELAAELQRQAVALTEEFPQANIHKLLTRLGSLEDYVRTHGHRPVSTKDGHFGSYREYLAVRLKSEATPAELKRRIRAVLAAPTSSNQGPAAG